MNINELYKLSIAGDKTAETELFRKLSEGFSLFLHRRMWNQEVVEDILQAALATVAEEFRQLEVTSSFSAWAYKVVENKFLAYLQTKRRQGGRYESLHDSDGYGKDWHPDLSLKRNLLKCLAGIARDKRQYARILNLVYQGFTVEEVCQRLSITQKQSYVILSRARSALRDCLRKNGAIR